MSSEPGLSAIGVQPLALSYRRLALLKTVRKITTRLSHEEIEIAPTAQS